MEQQEKQHMPSINTEWRINKLIDNFYVFLHIFAYAHRQFNESYETDIQCLCRGVSVCEQIRQNNTGRSTADSVFFFRKVEDNIYPFKLCGMGFRDTQFFFLSGKSLEY